MIEFTSDELKIIMNAIEFYKYEMNKTDNMDDYRAWKSAQKKYEDNLKYYQWHLVYERGGLTMNLQEEILKIKNEMLDEFDKRVEALKEEEQEFPKEDDVYWYINPLGFAFHDEWSGFITERHKIEIGNIFKTKEQADFAVEKLKVEAELRKFSRPFKEDDNNYFIQINSTYNNIVVDSEECYQTQGTIYFKNRFEARNAIESVGKERIKKYIFGVED